MSKESENIHRKKRDYAEGALANASQNFDGAPGMNPPEFSMKAGDGKGSDINSGMSKQPYQMKSDANNGKEGLVPNFQKAFKTDVSGVKVRPNSDKANKLGTPALAEGNMIHFKNGAYQPNTKKGQEMINHELVHVVQQRQGKVKANSNIGGHAVNDNKGLENEAHSESAKIGGKSDISSSLKGSSVKGATPAVAQGWSLKKAFKSVKKAASKAWGGAKKVGSKVAGGIKKGVGGLKSMAGKAIGGVKRIGSKLWGKAKGLGSKLWGKAKGIGSRLWGKAKGIGSKLWGKAKGFGSKLWGKAKGMGSKLWGKAKGFGSRLWGGIKKTGGWLKSKLRKGLNTVRKIAQKGGGLFKGLVSKFGGKIKGLIKKGLSGAQAVGSVIKGKIKKIGSKVFKGVKRIASDPVGALKDIASGIVSKGSQAFSWMKGVGKKVLGKAKGILKKIKGVGSGLWSGLKETGKSALNILKDVGGGLFEGFKQILTGDIKGGLGTALMGVVKGVMSGLDTLLDGTAGLLDHVFGPKGESVTMDQLGGNYQSDEILAHGLAYKGNAKDLKPGHADQLEAKGYNISTIQSIPGPKGFQMVVILPKEAYKGKLNPMVCFRGTDNKEGFNTDIDPKQVGDEQYKVNAGQIAQVIENLPGKVDVCGHSLGGALAQIAAATHTSKIGRVTTFQSPGVNKETVEMYNRNKSKLKGGGPEVNHHIVKQDLVSKAGDQNLGGNIYEHDLGKSTLDAHTSWTSTAGPHEIKKYTSQPHKFKRFVAEGVRSLIGNVRDGGISIFKKVKGGLGSIFSKVKGGVSGLLQRGKRGFRRIGGKVRSGLRRFGGRMRRGFGRMRRGFGRMRRGFGRMRRGFGRFGSKLRFGMRRFRSRLGSRFRRGFGRFRRGFGRMRRGFGRFGSKLRFGMRRFRSRLGSRFRRGFGRFRRGVGRFGSKLRFGMRRMRGRIRRRGKRLWNRARGRGKHLWNKLFRRRRKKKESEWNFRGIKINKDIQKRLMKEILKNTNMPSESKSILNSGLQNFDKLMQDQMSNMNLQSTMQKQSQAFQMISNLMKTLHETSKRVIQNMR